MTPVRPIHFVLVLLFAVAVLLVFLAYGGSVEIGKLSLPNERPSATTSSSAGQASLPSDLRAELDTLAKRVDALTEEIADLRRGADRRPAAPPTDTAYAPDREKIFRLIAEERDLRALPGRVEALRNAVVMWSVQEGKTTYVGPEIMDSIAALVDVEKRLEEIRRRLIPIDQPPDANGPWKAQLDLELAQLRTRRRYELARILGDQHADGLIGSLGIVQRF
jgi:cell division protein FtsB